MKYQVVSDKGYTMIVLAERNQQFLRKTSNNNYIYKAKDKTSYGYFTADGNLIQNIMMKDRYCNDYYL
jgi:hypothetical protein